MTVFRLWRWTGDTRPVDESYRFRNHVTQWFSVNLESTISKRRLQKRWIWCSKQNSASTFFFRRLYIPFCVPTHTSSTRHKRFSASSALFLSLAALGSPPFLIDPCPSPQHRTLISSISNFDTVRDHTSLPWTSPTNCAQAIQVNQAQAKQAVITLVKWTGL